MNIGSFNRSPDILGRLVDCERYHEFNLGSSSSIQYSDTDDASLHM